ncbi:MAG: hypothetical protein NUV98_01190 [Candidatus Roizmanbacteria bacterium]|nr:hypothetical protein [Candidatus Roizmanbacteria bacterium]
MKKRSIKVKRTTNTNLKYLLPVFVVSLLVLGGITYQNQQSTSVLGKNSSNQTVLGEESEASEKSEEIEEAEAPEPTEEPEPEEPTEAAEQEAEDIHDEIENEVEQGKVEKVEVHPTSEKSGEGMLKIERTNGSSSEKTIPSSTASLISVQNSQAGTVSISVNKDGTVTLLNNGVSVQTQYPVVIDPKSQTIAIRTPSGVTIINTVPSQALNGVGVADKPTIIQSAVLDVQDGQAFYEVTGTQDRKFIGLIPVTANVETKIDAQNGSIITVDKPWYLNLLGFLYTT